MGNEASNPTSKSRDPKIATKQYKKESIGGELQNIY